MILLEIYTWKFADTRYLEFEINLEYSRSFRYSFVYFNERQIVTNMTDSYKYMTDSYKYDEGVVERKF